MTETTSAQPTERPDRTTGALSDQVPARRGGQSPALHSGRGITTIDDSVVAKIASLAAREVAGVVELGGAAAKAIGGVMDRLRGDEHSTSGVGVEVGERQAAVDVAIRVEYPARIHEVASSVRENVIDRVETMTGLEVIEVNIAVIDLAFPGGQDDEESARPQSQRVE